MTIDLPESLLDTLQQQASRLGVPLEDLVRAALERQVNEDLPPRLDQEPVLPDPDQYFAEELATYERCKGQLEPQHNGKFVLIRGAEMIGIFDSSEKGSAEGRRRFGRRTKFMVHEIGDAGCEFLYGLL